MKYRALLVAGFVFLPIAAWTVSKDFNGRMWLAQVPGLPTSGDTAYSQWIDDKQGGLKPGQSFQNVDDGINNVIRDQAQANMPSQSSMQQQVSTAQQMAAKYGTPEGQAALKNMTPAQLMQLAQQMAPQGMARAVSPADQAQLQKINNGVYSGHEHVLEDVVAVTKEVNDIDARWTADSAAIDKQQAAQQSLLPTCKGEAGIPSSQALRDFELQYAEKRVNLAGKYLPQFEPLVKKMQAIVIPEIDFGDDALAAWTQIQDPGLKQQVSASAHGAESMGLGDVTMVEQLVERISQHAAKPVEDKNAIQRKYADAKGCQ